MNPPSGATEGGEFLVDHVYGEKFVLCHAHGGNIVVDTAIVIAVVAGIFVLSVVYNFLMYDFFEKMNKILTRSELTKVLRHN